MGTLIVIVFIVGLFVLLLWDSPQTRSTTQNENENDPIDLANSRHIGLLVGMLGGSIEDAAIARAALRRFASQHGRKPTFKEAGLVIGLMRSMRNR